MASRGAAHRARRTRSVRKSQTGEKTRGRSMRELALAEAAAPQLVEPDQAE